MRVVLSRGDTTRFEPASVRRGAGDMPSIHPTAPRSAVAVVLDELGVAASIFAPHGRELHRSTRLRELLATEPDAEPLLAAMRALALALLDPYGGRAPVPVAHDLRGTAGARAAYRARAVPLAPGGVAPDRVAVVGLERSEPSLPAIGDLVSRCGLTPREAEIALLLALGASDREIAGQLARSPHTVRKHVEHIFDKLRLHSRKALLLRLAEAASSAPARDAAPVVRRRRAVARRGRRPPGAPDVT